MRETIQKGLKKTDLLVFVNSINEKHDSIKKIQELWKGPSLFADYKTILDKTIKSNLVIYSGISDPRKFSEGIKNNNRKILKNFILHDHEEIDEKKASEIISVKQQFPLEASLVNLPRLLRDRKVNQQL